MKPEAIDHPKMFHLAKLLAIELYAANGIMERLWTWAGTHALEGDIGKWPDECIANACAWRADASALVSALVESRWIDLDEERRLVIHDWDEHCQKMFKERLRKRNERKRKASSDKHLPRPGQARTHRGHIADTSRTKRHPPDPDPDPDPDPEYGARAESPFPPSENQPPQQPDDEPLASPLAEAVRHCRDIRQRLTGSVLAGAEIRLLRKLAAELHGQGVVHRLGPAFSAFHADEHWQARGFPVSAFVSQFGAFDARARNPQVKRPATLAVGSRPRSTDEGPCSNDVPSQCGHGHERHGADRACMDCACLWYTAAAEVTR